MCIKDNSLISNREKKNPNKPILKLTFGFAILVESPAQLPMREIV